MIESDNHNRSKNLFISISFLLIFLLQGCGTLQKNGIPLGEALFSKGVLRLPAAPTDRFIILTIDDSPSSQTDALLDILSKYNVHATFFIHTDQISTKNREDAVERAAMDGGWRLFWPKVSLSNLLNLLI